MGAAEHLVHAGRLIALSAAGLLACGPDTDAAADDDAPAPSWSDPDDCNHPELDSEVLACGTWARELAVSTDTIAWLAGVRPSEVDTIDVVDPPPFGLFTTPRDGGESELRHPMWVVAHVAVGEHVYFDEDDTILRLNDDGTVTIVYARPAEALAAADGWVFWIAEGELWGTPEPADEAPVRLSDEGGAFALQLAAQDGRVAWTTDVGELFVRSIENGRPQLLSSALTTVHDLAVTSEAAYVAGDAGLQELGIDGTQPRWVYSTMAVTSVAANDRWIAFTPIDRSGIELAPRAGGDAKSLVDYREAATHGAVVHDVWIAGDALVWADTRILTHDLPE
jgi:hypothetical protein